MADRKISPGPESHSQKKLCNCVVVQNAVPGAWYLILMSTFPSSDFPCTPTYLFHELKCPFIHTKINKM